MCSTLRSNKGTFRWLARLFCALFQPRCCLTSCSCRFRFQFRFRLSGFENHVRLKTFIHNDLWCKCRWFAPNPGSSGGGHQDRLGPPLVIYSNLRVSPCLWPRLLKFSGVGLFVTWKSLVYKHNFVCVCDYVQHTLTSMWYCCWISFATVFSACRLNVCSADACMIKRLLLHAASLPVAPVSSPFHEHGTVRSCFG